MRKKKSAKGAFLIHCFLIVGVLFVIFPFLWMIFSSFKSLPDFYNFSFFPVKWDFSAYQFVFEKTEYVRWYLNSILVAITVTISCLIFNSLIGYTLAKHRFKGKNLIFILILSTLMIPSEMLVIPWYLLGVKAGVIDSYLGIMFPGLIQAFGIFLMRQFMKGIPDDTLDAARIDGMNEFRIWWSVVMPQVKPALSALGIITFLGNWNAYLWPVIAVTTEKMRTLPVGMAIYASADGGGIKWNVIMAMSTMAVVPMIIVFLIFQRKIVEGITLTGVKG
ncbi:carbohydrate ABC transporter permease [Metabacillus fastidiosus]|uniref:carbohydrate ABC transporter permease n=1 Tax=Metabacillus fastidiosus TaxID=1458 RepID=UPI002DBCE811|nr:carbohydrate ABC transporter permease [Metabacillus fastidiosus]MEC2078329.1 carbohydrate ABC transporter permease [Metabacillus fastidiosus]